MWSGTGYGTQVHQLMRHLRNDGHQVALFANYGLSGSKIVSDGFTIYPSAISSSGDDLLAGHASDWQADVVLVLYDAFAMDGRIQRMMPQLVMFWQPVDCEPMSQADLEQFTISGSQPVAMSKFGARMMKDAGLDPLYAPHAIDTQGTFLPAEGMFGHDLNSQAAKATLREENDLPEDAFLVGLNMHNKDSERKAIFEQMAAFALLHSRHSDTMLLAHTMPHPVMSGNDLVGMADFLGIGKAVRWADPYSLLAGNYTQDDMARWYAQLDLYTGASRGEGFGVPLIEAQACGVPVVATNASAMAELAGPGWLVDGQPYWHKGHMRTWTTPDIGQLADVYEQAYNEAGTPQAVERSASARLFSLRYDADKVYDKYWRPIWKMVESRLTTETPAGTDRAGWKLVQ